MKRNVTTRISHILLYALLVLLAVSVIYPLLWMVMSGFKTNNDLFTNSFGIPREWVWQNYQLAWKVGVGKFFANSIFVTVVSTLITTFISSLAAYSISRFEYRFKGAIFVFILAGLLLAPQVSLIPLYKILTKLGMYNTYLAMITPYVAFRIPFAVFLLRAYFLDLPRSLDEAAYIDGCTSFGVFIRIILPLAKPIIFSAMLLTAMYCWNEFMMALVFTSNENIRTIPIGLMNLRGTLRTEWGTLIAGLTMSALPMIVVFIIFQKQFVRGIAAGGVKG